MNNTLSHYIYCKLFILMHVDYEKLIHTKKTKRFHLIELQTYQGKQQHVSATDVKITRKGKC